MKKKSDFGNRIPSLTSLINMFLISFFLSLHLDNEIYNLIGKEKRGHLFVSSSILSSFDKTLSPRQVKTKYGFLRGILITVPKSSTSSLSGSSSSSSLSPSSSVSSSSFSSKNNASSTPFPQSASPSSFGKLTVSNVSASAPFFSSSHNFSSSSSFLSASSSPSLLSSVLDMDPIEAFLGVPYASPPVGSLRFMPPVTANHWRTVRVANNLSPSCPQKIPASQKSEDLPESRKDQIKRLKPFFENYSEDCLYLNIYMPFNRGTNEKLAVMVIITGESYLWGSSGSAFDGTILASAGHVIVVTFNYRLGIFGFLPSRIEGMKRGNYALLDMIAVLHWIQDNILEFGGNPSNVTLLGHGRGSAAANLLLLSPMAKGLFSRAILMSGSALSPWAISRDPEYYVSLMSKSLKCDPAGSLNECLRSRTVEQLLEASDSFDEDVFKSTFGPIIDGLLIPVEPITLLETINDQSNNNVLSYSQPIARPGGGAKNTHKILAGVTRSESPFIFSEREEKSGIESHERRDTILYSLITSIIDYYQEIILFSAINEYNDWSSPPWSTSSSFSSTSFSSFSLSSSGSSSSGIDPAINNMDSLLDILGDALITGPLTRTITYLANRKISDPEQSSITRTSSLSPPTYFYVYNHSPDGSKFSSSRTNSAHGDELAFLFGVPIASSIFKLTAPTSSPSPFGSFSTNVNYSFSDIQFSFKIISYFTNFVKFGNPNGQSIIKSTSPSKFTNSFKSSNFSPSPGITADDDPWPEYDLYQRRYMTLGQRSRVKDNYRTHRLSFWNNLVPKLQVHGKIESEKLKKHFNSLSADQMSRNYLGAGANESSEHFKRTNEDKVAVFERISLKFLNQLEKPFSSGTRIKDESSSITPSSESAATIAPIMTDVTKSSDKGSSNSNIRLSTSPVSESSGSSDYSSALSVTIAIGMSLLILNIIVFMGVYYKLHNHTKKNVQTRRKKNQPLEANNQLAGETPGHNSNTTLPRASNNTAPRNVSNSLKRRPNGNQVQQFNSQNRNSIVAMPDEAAAVAAMATNYNYHQEQQMLHQMHHEHQLHHEQQLQQQMYGQTIGHVQNHAHHVHGHTLACYNSGAHSNNSSGSNNSSNNTNSGSGNFGGKRCHFADEMTIVTTDSNLDPLMSGDGAGGSQMYHSLPHPHHSHAHHFMNQGILGIAAQSQSTQQQQQHVHHVHGMPIVVPAFHEQVSQQQLDEDPNNQTLTVISELDEHL